MRAMWFALAGALVVGIGCTPAPKPPAPPPPPPRIESFTATPSQLSAGEKVKLEWSTRDAATVEVQQVGKGLISGADALSGSVEVTVEEDALFVLTAKNARGVTENAAVIADVAEAADEVLFTASPARVNAGGAVTLAWSAIGARSVSLEVKDGAPVDVGTQLQSGVVSVIPDQDTTWVLTVDGLPYEASVEVVPVVNAFAVTPGAVNPGDTVTASWKTSGASKVTVSRSGEGVIDTETDAGKVVDGSFSWKVPATIDPAAAITFGLTAESASGAVSETTFQTVYVAGAPRVRQVTVPAWARKGGTFEVSWLTSGADRVQVLEDGVVVNDVPSSGLLDEGSATLDTPSQDAVIQIRALSSRGGEHTSDPWTVSPVDVPTVTNFTASTPNISSGGDLVTLTWNVPSARNLQIVAKNQYTITRVTGLSAETGSVEVYPNENTEYVLTADNGIGDSVTATTGLITVGSAAHLVFSPAAAPVGGTVQLTGTTVTNAGSLRALNFVVKNAPGDAFVDITNLGAPLPFAVSDYTVSKLITLSDPFDTELFGTALSTQTISVSTNGWASFAPSPIVGPVNYPTSLPSVAFEPYALLPWGRKLRMGFNSHVYWLDDRSGPTRRIIIQWDNMEYYGANTRVITVEAQLYPDHVVFAYPALTSNLNDVPLIGIINGDETGVLAPSAVQLTNGRPSPGDTLSFFGEVPNPYTFQFDGTPLEVEAKVGTGVIHVSDAPAEIPAGELSISEVNNRPVAGHGEWIELTSNVGTNLDLDGWVIDFGGGLKHTITGPLTLPAHGRVLLGQDPDAAEQSSGGPAVDYVYGAGFSMEDGAGSVSIEVAGLTYASLSWPSLLPEGVAFQNGLPSPAATYASNVTVYPCAANQSYGASGQLGTPGQPNTTCIYPYAMSAGAPNTFISLASSPGSQIVNGLSGSATTNTKVVQLTLDRPVQVFGLGIIQLSVDSNGYLTFVPTAGSYGTNNSTLSTGNPNGVLAPFWDDLVGNANGAVRWEQFDPDGTSQSGDEYTVVAWEDWAISGVTSSLNFEVVFLEGSGDIEFRYGDMTASDASRAMGSSATTWFEEDSGHSALRWNVNSASSPGIAPNSSILFTAQ